MAGRSKAGLTFFVSCLVLAFLINRGCRPGIQSMARENAVHRQVEYLCVKLATGRATQEEVCSRPLIEIAEFAKHFRELRAQDGAWYLEHGSNYFPAVDCSGGQAEYSLLGETFVCEGAAARRIR